MLKKTVMAGAVAAALGSGLAQAAEPASPHTLTGNVGLYSQYIFRGLTQTNREPALQGGFDYSHSSGFYLGTWASNISWLRDGVRRPGLQRRRQPGMGFLRRLQVGLRPDWTLDLGTLYYWYPGDVAPGLASRPTRSRSTRASALEVAVGEVLVQRRQQDLRRAPTADGTWYLDLGINIPLGDFAKEATGLTSSRTTASRNSPAASVGDVQQRHAARTTTGRSASSYTLPKDFTIGVFYTDTEQR